MKDDLEDILFTQEQLAAIVARLGAKISEDYRGRCLLLVGVLKGSVVFMADLMRAVTVPCDIDFLSVTSYGRGAVSTGEVRVLKDLDTSIEGRDVLIVEDILDSGMTLKFLIGSLLARRPGSLRICTLLDKPDRRRADVTPDYVGAQVPDKFLVGYGLDYAEKYRNLPYLAVLKPQIYGGG